MKTIGILDGFLCTLIEGARIIVETKITNDSTMNDLIEYGNLPVFKSWDEMEKAAYSYPSDIDHWIENVELGD